MASKSRSTFSFYLARGINALLLTPLGQTLLGGIGATEAWGTARGPAFRQEVACKSNASGAAE